MEIPANQFKEVLLCQTVDLDNQLYGLLLDTCPKTLWARFVIWLKSLGGNDHFDKVRLSVKILEFIEQGVENRFFDEIDPAQIQTGIDNLVALRNKFASPSTFELLNQSITLLSRFTRPVQLDEKTQEAYLGTQEVFKSQNSSFYLQNRTVEYLGKENLQAVFKEHEEAINRKQISSGELVNIAKIRMEKLTLHNQRILDMLPKYFKTRQDVLKLFFPSYAGQYKELWRKLTCGHLTFDHQHYYCLFQAMKSPQEAHKWLELQANSPVHLDNAPCKEKTRILEGLLELRNHCPFNSSL